MAETRVARASSSAKNWAANRQELMRKAEERREQAAQGQLTEEHTFQPVVPRARRTSSKLSKLASGINQTRTATTPTVLTVSTATQTDAGVSKARAVTARPRRPRSSSPSSRRLERRSLGTPTASFAQRSGGANTGSLTPMSVPLQKQKWEVPLTLQKDAQSLAALALAVVGNAMVDRADGPNIAASDSPEHAGSAACAREEAADSAVLLARLCADSSMEDVHSKTASQPEVERPSAIAQDSPSDRESTDGETRALRFDNFSMSQGPISTSRVRFSCPFQAAVHERAPAAPRRSASAWTSAAPEWCSQSPRDSRQPCRISWQEVAPDSDGGCGDSSDLSELEDLGRNPQKASTQYRSFVLPRNPCTSH